jgi:hypothetical protein
MKRHASQLSLILAALAFAPAAIAGSDIVKCVDQAGHVTLTDQPCSGDAATVQLTRLPAAPAPEASVAQAEVEDTGVAPAAHPPQVERHVAARGFLPVAHTSWKQPAARAATLSGDVATLKAARVQQLLLDGSRPSRQPRLAGLH